MFILCSCLVWMLQYFKKKKIAPQNIKKNCPQKLLIIPLDHQFSVQQVFSHCLGLDLNGLLTRARRIYARS